MVATFDWSSADPAIATVRKSDGAITAISAGSTTVTATVGTISASATVSVSVRPVDPPVAVSISSSALSLFAGGTERLTARVVDSRGRTMNASLEWSSADPAVATVGNTDGVVTAIAAGSTTVTVVAGALRATATVSVTAWDAPFAFTRVTLPSSGIGRSDVLGFLSFDGSLHSLPRPANVASIGAPAWSPDGTRLALEVSHDFYFCPWLEYKSDLYVLDGVNPASSSWRALTANGLSKAPSWSPDGKRIAYLQQDELGDEYNDIYIVDAAGGAPVRVTWATGTHTRPSWSPDGTRLAFSRYVEAADGYSRIYTVNVDGSGLKNLTPSGAWDFDPSWSPDGTRLAFVSRRDDPLGSGVFVINADGSNVRRLTPMIDYMSTPAWSPDGQRIMFSMGPALYVMKADGSSLTKLTTPPLDSWDVAPAWRR
jgi:hypothetical protein